MSKTLDKLTIRLCEDMPFDFTIHEKDGFCKKPNDYCNYCKKNDKDNYFCHKKTYNSNQKLNHNTPLI